jgi:hypothetical protein
LRRSISKVRTRLALLSALDSWGFEASRQRGQSVDGRLAPLPWYTYPAIAFLDGLDFSGCQVGEWGSGNSTLYWSRHAQSVRAIEHDPTWVELLSQQGLPSNVELIHAAETAEYVGGLGNKSFDVVVIDGLHRAACAERGLQRLKPSGLIVLDNSDWLPKTAASLRGAGLIQVDFHGLGPINDYPWCTSLFFAREFVNRPRDRQPRRDPLSLERDWDDDPIFGT